MDLSAALEHLETAARRPIVVEVDEKQPRLFVPEGWTETHEHVWQPDPVRVTTLSALVAYLAANRDGLALEQLAVFVENPESVVVSGKLVDHQLRDVYLSADSPLEPFRFGQWMDAERFIIGLQHQFTDQGNRDALLNLVGAITESSVRETVEEGGYAQKVKVGRGITMVGEEKITNPVTLAPFRTFAEVEQPSSPFVLRLKPGSDDDPRPLCALFEADGGAWRLDASRRVGEHLEAGLKTESVDVPVFA